MKNDKQVIFSDNYKVRSTQVNLNNNLGLYGILGMLQDVAVEHSQSLGFGLNQLLQKGFIWVLTQQKLKMNRWPEWNEVITISTWSLPAQGAYVVREFEIFHKGEKIGECSSLWITIDIKTRRPIDLSASKENFYPRIDYTLDFKTNRVQMPENMKLVQNRKVQVSDLDVYLHVNNVKYTKWVLDMMSIAQQKEYLTKEYEINFLSETHLGDQVEGYRSEPIWLENNQMQTFFCGRKVGQDKPAFISKWTVERKCEL